MPETAFTRHAGVEVPLICGAMYPCSNPELVGAVSAAGGLGIVQPISLTFVHGHEMRAGLRLTKQLAGGKPIGFNALIEASSKVYLDRMKRWVDIALEEGVRFFVTALGNPDWVVERVHAAGGVVYHDVTERKWAHKGLDAGAGGHAGNRDPRALYDELADLGVPLVCAGGVGDAAAFVEALQTGYAAVQMGTRFIATAECKAHGDYKQAIVRAEADDIVHTDKISGVPVAVIKTPYIEKMGLKAGFVARRLLRHPRFKHYVRTYYSLKSIWTLKQASLKGMNYKDFFQAGRSVSGVKAVEPAGDVVRRFAEAAAAADAA